MGIDLLLQALPDGCPLFPRAASDAALGELLSFLPFCLRDVRAGEIWRRPPLEAEEMLLLEEARRLLALDPELASRCISLDRSWEGLHHLLSPDFREGTLEPDTEMYSDPGSVLVRGAERMGPCCVSGQGMRMRWTSPARAAHAFAALEGSTEHDLAACYDWGVMKRDGIYKHPPREYWAEDLEDLLERWRGLKAFYSDAVRMRYGVLHILW